jgi:hypothetical protein
MQNRTRNRQLNLKFTEEEFNFITKKKETAKVQNYTDFIMKIATQSQLVIIDTKPLLEVAYEVNKIGVNVNQMAKVANTSGSIYKGEFENLKNRIDELEGIIQKCFDTFVKTKEGEFDGLC